MVSVAPVLADEDDGVAMGRETVAGEVDVVADALRAVAVVAHAVEAAGRITAQTRRVDGSSDITGTSQGSLDGGCYLVQSDDVNHVMRSPSDSGNTVATSVNIDDDAILSDGIGAGEEVVHVHRIEVAFALFLIGDGLVTVNDLIGATLDEFTGQPHLTDSLRTTPSDTASLGHK